MLNLIMDVTVTPMNGWGLVAFCHCLQVLMIFLPTYLKRNSVDSLGFDTRDFPNLSAHVDA